MLANPLLQAIEQDRLRNQQAHLAQQQRLMGLTQALVPTINPVTQNTQGDPQPSVMTAPQTPQQAYNSAVNWTNPTGLVDGFVKAVMPGAPVISVAADMTRKASIGKPGVRQLSDKPYGYYGQMQGWSDKPSQNTPYQSSAWNALRNSFKPSPMAPDAATADNFSAESAEDAAANNGWGGSVENFGAAFSAGGFDETYGGPYGGDNGGGMDDSSWGGAGESAFGGDVGDFGGFA
jgi:hypothetical protein